MATPAKADLPPVDPNTPIPPSVLKNAARAEAIHAQAYPKPDAPQPTPQPAPAADNSPAPPPAPQPVPPPAQSAEPPAPPQPQPAPSNDTYPDKTANLTADQWRHQYLSMRGRYEQAAQSIGALQEQLAETSDQLMRASHQQPRPAAVQPPTAPSAPLITQDEINTYSPELTDFVKRAARDAVMPELQNVHSSVRQVSQRVQQVSTESLYEALATAVPDWQAINVHPRFKAWCGKPDVYSGALRGKLLNAAFQAGNAPRVIAFFKGFLQEEQATGQLQDPSVPPASQPARQPAVSLEMLAAPGRAHPAGGDTQLPVEKPVYSRAQIAAFYNAVRAGSYVGREQEKATLEQSIFLAQREGRVR